MSSTKVKIYKFKAQIDDIIQGFQFNGEIVENGFNLISPIYEPLINEERTRIALETIE